MTQYESRGILETVVAPFVFLALLVAFLAIGVLQGLERWARR